MNAILTRFLGPTDHRGSRIAASSYAGRLVTGYRHELSDHDNHRAAAEALARNLRWLRPGSRLVQGRLPSGDVAHVIVLDDSDRIPPTPTVLIVRHPDAETAVTVSPPGAARIIVADLGSSFDGQPDPESPDEMDAARELAAELRTAVADLAPRDDVRQTALSIADELEHPWSS